MRRWSRFWSTSVVSVHGLLCVQALILGQWWVAWLSALVAIFAWDSMILRRRHGHE